MFQGQERALGTGKGLMRDFNVDRTALIETFADHKLNCSLHGGELPRLTDSSSAGSVTKKPAADCVHTPVGGLAEGREKYHAG
jgi:hypothetical protein